MTFLINPYFCNNLFRLPYSINKENENGFVYEDVEFETIIINERPFRKMKPVKKVTFKSEGSRIALYYADLLENDSHIDVYYRDICDYAKKNNIKGFKRMSLEQQMFHLMRI